MNINFLTSKIQFFFQLEKKLKHSCEPLEILWTAGTLSNEEPWGLGLSLPLASVSSPPDSSLFSVFLTSPPVKPHPMLCIRYFILLSSLTGIILMCVNIMSISPWFTCLLSDSPVRV